MEKWNSVVNVYSGIFYEKEDKFHNSSSFELNLFFKMVFDYITVRNELVEDIGIIYTMPRRILPVRYIYKYTGREIAVLLYCIVYYGKLSRAI